MAARRTSTKNPGAGGVTDSLPSSLPDRGLSAVTVAKQTTDPFDDLLDSLLEASSRQPGPKCATGALLKEMPPDRAEKVRRLIDESNRSNSEIADALQKLGYRISHNQIRNHRARVRGAGCRCE